MSIPPSALLSFYGLSDSQQGVSFQHKNEWTFSYDLSQKTFASLECKRTIKEGFWIRLTLYRIFASQTPSCRLVATHIVFIANHDVQNTEYFSYNFQFQVKTF